MSSVDKNLRNLWEGAVGTWVTLNERRAGFLTGFTRFTGFMKRLRLPLLGGYEGWPFIF
jgi:hypothetical protein